MRTRFFIQMSDTHIQGAPYLGVDTHATFRRTLEAIGQLHVKPEFFIISGDLANKGDVEGYEQLKELLKEIEAKFGVPVLLGLGNHDKRVGFRKVFLGEESPNEDDRYYYAQEIDGLRIIMLDSKIPGKTEGDLDAAQLTWLRETLRQPAPAGTVLVMHHAPFANARPSTDSSKLQRSDELAEIVRANQHQILGLLHGHTHVVASTLWNGALSMTAPGVALQIDPTVQEGIDFIGGSGFSLGVLRDDRLVMQPIILPGERPLLFAWDGKLESIKSHIS